MFHLKNSGSTSTATNQLLASLTELIGRAFIEKNYFQNAQIPMTTLIYLVNDLINALNHSEPKKEKMSLSKELVISYKQFMGKELTKEEQKYDDEIHELDVMSEIMSGVKYTTSFSIFKSLYNSISSVVTQNLSEHIPAIVGSTAAVTVAPYLLSKAIEKVLAKSHLSTEQKAIVTPWLNTLGRLALVFTPKVEANESGVNYQYPSTEGHKELFKAINISVTQNGKHLLGDKADNEMLSEKLGFKLRRIQLGDNNSVEVIGIDKNDEEVKLSFSERHFEELALTTSLRGSLRLKQSSADSPSWIASLSLAMTTTKDTAYNYLPTPYTLTNLIIAFGTQKILLKNSSPFFPVLMTTNLFLKPVKAQGIGAVGTEFLVNTYINNTQQAPKIAKLKDGGFVAVWESCNQDGLGSYAVYGKRYSAGGKEFALPTSGINTALGNEFRINTYTINYQQYTAVSALNDGGFVVVWQSFPQDGSINGVYGKRFAANGTEISLPTSGINTAIGNEFKINAYTTGDQEYPAISALNDGGFIVVWNSCQNGADFDVFGKRFAVNGTEVPLPTSGLNTALGNEFRINTYTANSQWYPAVSALNDGGFVVVWMSYNQDGSYSGVYGKRFAANGVELALPSSGLNTALGNEFRINTYTTNTQQSPAISALNDGGFVVVWESGGSTQDGSGYGVYGKRFAMNGTELAVPTSGINTAVGNEFLINTYTANTQQSPAISALNDGGFVVVWESGGSTQDGSGYGVYGKRFAMNGTELALPSSGLNTALGNEFRINAYTTNSQWYPAVYALNDGGFVALWQSSNQTGMGCDVFGQRFAVNGKEIPLFPSVSSTLPATTSSFLSTSPTTKLNSIPTKKTPTPSQPLNKSSTTNTTIPLVAALISACVVVTGIGVGTFFLTKKLKNSKQKNSNVEELHDIEPTIGTEDNSKSVLEPITSNRDEKTRTIIEKKYALINKITEEEAKALKIQTGLDVKFLPGKKKTKFLLGEGQFSKLRLAQDIKSNEFLGVKKIKGDDEIKASEQEATIQNKFKNTPNIMPLLASCRSKSSEGNDALYQFMPLASFGNGEFLRNLLKQSKNTEQNEKILLHVLKSLLLGLQSMHQQHVYHLDLKPANIVFKPSGELFIIDFGCAVESENGMIGKSNGDSRYFSPERYAAYRTMTQGNFDGAQNDAWALGVTLLEMVIGRYPFAKELGGFAGRIATCTPEYLETVLSNLPEWSKLQDSMVGKIIHGLLSLNIRLSIDTILKLPVLQKEIFNLNEECEKIFTELKLQSKNLENKNSSNAESDYILKEKDENYVRGYENVSREKSSSTTAPKSSFFKTTNDYSFEPKPITQNNYGLSEQKTETSHYSDPPEPFSQDGNEKSRDYVNLPPHNNEQTKHGSFSPNK